MKHKLINSQLSNWMTYQMYLRQFLTLAENVFIYDNMPDYIDTAYLNKTLVRQGAIAFFYDDVLEKVLALPYTSIGSLDVYNNIYKNLNKKANIFKSHINTLTSKIQNVGDEANLRSTLSALVTKQKRINELLEDSKRQIIEAQTIVKMSDPNGIMNPYKLGL